MTKFGIFIGGCAMGAYVMYNYMYKYLTREALKANNKPKEEGEKTEN